MVPTKLVPLAPRRVFFRANGRTVVKHLEHTTTDSELIIATMRDSVHAVAFAWRGPADRQALLRAITESHELADRAAEVEAVGGEFEMPGSYPV
jgi:hypothetical protein